MRTRGSGFLKLKFLETKALETPYFLGYYFKKSQRGFDILGLARFFLLIFQKKITVWKFIFKKQMKKILQLKKTCDAVFFRKFEFLKIINENFVSETRFHDWKRFVNAF